MTRLGINSDTMHLEEANNDLQRLFSRLAKSKFRSKFKLGKTEHAYLQDKGLRVIEKHASDFVTERLMPARPKNDGKQTPMKKSSGLYRSACHCDVLQKMPGKMAPDRKGQRTYSTTGRLYCFGDHVLAATFKHK